MHQWGHKCEKEAMEDQWKGKRRMGKGKVSFYMMHVPQYGGKGRRGVGY